MVEFKDGERVTQIQVNQGHESGFVLTVLTNLGRVFCQLDGMTAKSGWFEIKLPPKPRNPWEEE